MTAFHILHRAILAATAGASLPRPIRTTEKTVLRLGVLTDLSGSYSDTYQYISIVPGDEAIRRMAAAPW